jgi:hypothetical protein
MSMSGSEAGPGSTGRIWLQSQQPGVEFAVRNAALLVVKSGIGRIDASVDPGLYRIEERAGNAEREVVIALRAGEIYRRADVVLPFPCVAPVAASSTAPPEFAPAVEQASEAAARHGGRDPVLIVARCRSARLVTGLGDGFELLDAALRPIPAGAENTYGPGAAVTVSTRRLPAGGYVLRSPFSPAGVELVDRPVWLDDGWQTIVFAVTGDDEPVGVSVHMVPADVPWRAGDPAHTAVEAAAAAFHRGLSILRDESVDDQLLTRNPILGMLGAYALRRETRPDGNAYNRVVGRLEDLVPEHPDVRALATSRSRGHASQLDPVSWPPLLTASYRALLAADADGGAALRAGSPAERIAASVVPGGPWLAWVPGEDGLGPVAPDEPPPGRAAERVQRFLAMVADFEHRPLTDVILQWDQASIAQSTDLPIRTVQLIRSALGSVTFAVPDDVSSLFALVVSATYAGPEGEAPATRPARLEFDASTAAVLGPEVRGRLSRRATELVVTLTNVAADLPPLSVETGEPDAVAVRLESSGGSVRARLPWHRPGLPERLVFRIVAG